ncbi:Cytochrome P450 [Quillaja saponaria]|uniref:Cytochrome P450 n=1 Tax=Quillaja saponaria TaxID=32244 RepID=A0AAD7KU54_QUISA|nr:Cytochrome P450 [Quillaja saponaria]
MICKDQEEMDMIALLQQCLQYLHKTSSFTTILLSLLLLLSLQYLLKLTRGPKLNFPPSPPKLPLIGNLHQLDKPLHRTFQALSNKYGSLVLLHIGSTPTLVVSSADIAAQIMKSNDVIFGQRTQTKAANTLFYGCSDIGFSPYGGYWRQAKKICVMELLSTKRVQEFHYVREQEIAEMVEKIRSSCLDGAVVDLSEIFVTISNNIVSMSSLGQKYDREDGKENFGVIAKRAIGLLGAFCFEDSFPYLGFMDVLTGFCGTLRKTYKELNTLLDQVIEEHQKKSENDQSEKKDLVDILLHLQRDGKLDINLTRDNIKAILMDMFVGGTDGTATAIEWAMAEIVKNPIVMKKAQEEVRRVVGKKLKVDESNVKEMSYLQCIIKESLRLHAPVLEPRTTSVGTKLEGYDIPPRTTVVINAWAIQRDSKLWEKPEEFLPERFTNNPVDFTGKHNQFIPFGMGRRSCPGVLFAMAEAENVLANLLYWFDWRLPSGLTMEDLDMADVCGLVIQKKLPLLLVPVLHSI